MKSLTIIKYCNNLDIEDNTSRAILAILLLLSGNVLLVVHVFSVCKK